MSGNDVTRRSFLGKMGAGDVHGQVAVAEPEPVRLAQPAHRNVVAQFVLAAAAPGALPSA